MTLALRTYDASDRAACWQVFYRAVREGAAGFYDKAQCAAWAPTPLPGPGGHDKLLGQWCWVAERAGQIVGFMSLDRAGYLDMAYVLPEEMGKGTAGALHDALLSQARLAGLARLTVDASHLARRFLLRRGWQVTYMENFSKDGQVLERYRMFLDIPGRIGAGTE